MVTRYFVMRIIVGKAQAKKIIEPKLSRRSPRSWFKKIIESQELGPGSQHKVGEEGREGQTPAPPEAAWPPAAGSPGPGRRGGSLPVTP